MTVPLPKICCVIKMGRPRVELGANRLKAECSTTELASRCAEKSDFLNIAQLYKFKQDFKYETWLRRLLELSMSLLVRYIADLHPY